MGYPSCLDFSQVKIIWSYSFSFPTWNVTSFTYFTNCYQWIFFGTVLHSSTVCSFLTETGLAQWPSSKLTFQALNPWASANGAVRNTTGPIHICQISMDCRAIVSVSSVFTYRNKIAQLWSIPGTVDDITFLITLNKHMAEDDKSFAHGNR